MSEVQLTVEKFWFIYLDFFLINFRWETELCEEEKKKELYGDEKDSNKGISERIKHKIYDILIYSYVNSILILLPSMYIWLNVSKLQFVYKIRKLMYIC